MGNEGGYTVGENDPGGETNWGISKRSYPDVDIKNLTRDDAKSIYLRDFWNAAQMDQYNPAISFQVFDAAVNHGIPEAIKLLQIAARVNPDGKVGPVTVAAVRSARVADTLALFIAARLEFWTGLHNWTHDGKGWALRAVADIRYAVIDFNAGITP